MKNITPSLVYNLRIFKIPGFISFIHSKIFGEFLSINFNILGKMQERLFSIKIKEIEKHNVLTVFFKVLIFLKMLNPYSASTQKDEESFSRINML